MSHTIKFIITLVLVVALVALVEPASSSFNSSSSSNSRERYIVFLNSQSGTTKHFRWLKRTLNRSSQKLEVTDFSASAIDKNMVMDFSVDGKAYGYTTWFSSKFVKERLSKRQEVLMIEKDSPVKIKATQKNPNPNLDRIDQAKFPLNKQYTFPDSAGAGAEVYVVDTGVLVSHSEFEGRATFGGAFCSGCPNTDDNGHGSHVSGIVAGKTFGVAKKAKIIGVKVLAADGSGTNADVINGLMFVLSDHKKKNNSAVVNMSLGGTLSSAVNLAVQSLTGSGVHVVVAAGNEATDACGSSPASEPSAITVGATEDTNDSVADFSNIGKCVDLFAPGRNILSVGIGNNDDTAVFSGTSQATPHVAGTVALIIGESGNLSPNKMATTLINLATKNVLVNLPNDGSPDEFLRLEQILSSDKEGKMLYYQMKFNVPDLFYDKYEIKNYKLGTFKIDFILIEKELIDGKMNICLKIFDAKSSKYEYVFQNYKIQITLYHRLLEQVTRKIGKNDISINIEKSGIILGQMKDKCVTRTPANYLGSECFLEEEKLEKILQRISDIFENEQKCS
ncbi:9743_t:CDS:2, partial [Acaulospora morrowiae]